MANKIIKLLLVILLVSTYVFCKSIDKRNLNTQDAPKNSVPEIREGLQMDDKLQMPSELSPTDASASGRKMKHNNQNKEQVIESSQKLMAPGEASATRKPEGVAVPSSENTLSNKRNSPPNLNAPSTAEKPKISSQPATKQDRRKENDTDFGRQAEEPIETNTNSTSETKDSEPIEKLLQVREEINKIRSIMQILREQQLKMQSGAHIPNSPNITETQQQNLQDFIKTLKEQGQISTKPLSEQNSNTPVDIAKLTQDINKLKATLNSFTKYVDAQKNKTGAIEQIEDLLQKQGEEIEKLKKMVDTLPPEDFPNPGSAVIKEPLAEKAYLHQQLLELQAILSDLMNKQTEVNTNLRNAAESTSKTTLRKILERLLKIVKIISHSDDETQSKFIEGRLEQFEKQLDNLDKQSQKMQQEILEKILNEVQNLQIHSLNDHNETSSSKTGEKNPELHDLSPHFNPENTVLTLDDAKDRERSSSIKYGGTTSVIYAQPHILQVPFCLSKNPHYGHSAYPYTSSSAGQNQAVPHQGQGYVSPLSSSSQQKYGTTHYQGSNQPYPPNSPINAGYKPNSHYPTHYTSQGGYPQIHSPGLTSDLTGYELNPLIITQDAYEAKPPTMNQQDYEPKPSHVAPAYSYPSNPSTLDKYPTNPYPPAVQEGYDTKQEAKPSKFSKITTYNSPVDKNPSYEQKYIEKGVKPVQQTIYSEEALQPSKSQPQKSPLYHSPSIITKEDSTVNNYGNKNPEYYSYGEEIPSPYSSGSNNAENQPCYPRKYMNIHEETEKLSKMMELLKKGIGRGDSYLMDYRQTGKPREKRAVDNNNKQDLIHDIHQRLTFLRKNIEDVQSDGTFEKEVTYPILDENSARTAYEDKKYYYQPYGNKYQKIQMKQKFDDLFIKIVKFILHKMEISAPYVVDSLFNGDLYIYEPDYGSGNYGYENSYSNKPAYNSYRKTPENEELNYQDLSELRKEFEETYMNMPNYNM